MTLAPAPRRFLGNRLLRAGGLLVGLLVLTALTASLLAPHRPDQQFIDGLDDGMPVGPCARFPLGTDGLGRDVCSRLLHGSRISLVVGLVAMLTATVLGTLVGLLAGYCGRWVDEALMRGTDVMMALPPLLLALALAGLLMEGRPIPLLGLRLQRGLISVFLVIGVVSWTGIARVVRAQVLSLKEREFVLAARVLGCSGPPHPLLIPLYYFAHTRAHQPWVTGDAIHPVWLVRYEKLSVAP